MQFSTLLISIFLIIHLIEITIGQGRYCKTKYWTNGQCRNFNACNKVVDNHRKYESSKLAFLRNIECGFDGSDPMVCCPSQPGRRSDANIHETYQKCGENKHPPVNTERIAGGKSASLGEWPWVAAIGYSSKFWSDIKWGCGGVLVSKRHVLTAAHCVLPGSIAKPEVVRLGDLVLDHRVDDGASPIEMKIHHVTIHIEYIKEKKINDIAILTLLGSVTFTDNIHPICLPDPALFGSDALVGEKVYVAGWGTEYNNGPASKDLQFADVNITDEWFCQNAYKTFAIDKRVLCANNYQKDACRGDSGGPLMLYRYGRYYLVGLVSYGRGCAQLDSPGVYTRVSSYLGWIQKNLV